MSVDRRTFLQSTATTGALAALASTLDGAPRKKERRTFFFNFSNHPNVGGGKFYAFIEGSIYPLTPAKGHSALLTAQQTNAFLGALPANSVTHLLQDVETSADSVSLSYTFTRSNSGDGTWSMSHVFFVLPTASLSHAHKQAKKLAAQPGSLNLSAKRDFYGVRAATSLQDLVDENALVDANEHASALTMLHPDVLNIDSNSAAHVKTNYVDTTASTKTLAKELLILGPAAPAGGQTFGSSPGWATMSPITDDNGQPVKYDATDPYMGGLVMCQPVINPTLANSMSAAAGDASTSSKNDTSLGADISGGIPGAGNLQGKTWSLHTGQTAIDQSPDSVSQQEFLRQLQLGSDNAAVTLVKVSDDSGFILSGGSTETDSGLVNVSLTATNSFVRWLAVYIIFRKENGDIIPAKDLPQGISAGSGLDLSDALYLGVITPQFTIYGAPVQDSTLKISFTWPAGATTADVLASGLGKPSASHIYPQTEVLGIVMTTLTCFVVPAFVLAFAAVPGVELVIAKLFAVPLVNLLIQETLALWELAGSDKSALFAILWRAVAKIGIAVTFSGLNQVVQFLVIMATSVESCLRAASIAGLIVQAIGMAGIAADIARATYDVCNSPWTYKNSLKATHNISVNLLPDPCNDRFPETATHYAVTAVFDDGMPHTQTLSLAAPPIATLPPVTFPAVPLYGKVNIMVAFYANTEWQAGQGETGLIDNSTTNFQTPPTITLKQNQIPIGSSTTYQHQSKTALNGNGDRVWQGTPVAPTEKDAGNCNNAPGQLCSLRKITVRQGTATTTGNIGYAWGAYSSGVQKCSVGGSGVLDQLANIGTINPQSQYAAISCGLNPGVKLTYNLQGNPKANYYLDSTSNILRQVTLDTPGFADPTQSQNEQLAFGQLNLDSTDLLLHPGGRVISLNAANHKFESLPVPASAAADSDAVKADLYSGQGSRPGLMHTPAAAAITAHGVVLVIESGNNRIQALDTCANPVALFAKQSQQNALQLKATDSDNFEYLDLAVEYSGYIYVLSRNLNSNRYQLDIYHPSQSDTSPISTTFDINAARLAVDLWRTVYTLNYEILKMPDGSIPTVTEPTVSLWTPSAPPAGPLLSGRPRAHGPQKHPKPGTGLGSCPSSSAFSAPRPLRRREFFKS